MDLLEEYSGMLQPDPPSNPPDTQLKCPECGSTRLHVLLYYEAYDRHVIEPDGTLGGRLGGDTLDDLVSVNVDCTECGALMEADLDGDRVVIL